MIDFPQDPQARANQYHSMTSGIFSRLLKTLDTPQKTQVEMEIEHPEMFGWAHCPSCNDIVNEQYVTDYGHCEECEKAREVRLEMVLEFMRGGQYEG